MTQRTVQRANGVRGGENRLLTPKTIASSAGWTFALLAGALIGGTVWAESSPVGLWRTIDDATGKAKSAVRIVENAGVFSGRIEQIFDPDPGWDGRCDKCRDERKDQPVLGMLILTNLRKSGDEYAGEVPRSGKRQRIPLPGARRRRRTETRGAGLHRHLALRPHAGVATRAGGRREASQVKRLRSETFYLGRSTT